MATPKTKNAKSATAVPCDKKTCRGCGRRLSRELYERSDGSTYRVCSAWRCLAVTEVEAAHEPKYSRYIRGRSAVYSRPLYGYLAQCRCGWSKRVNGRRREAEQSFKDHHRSQHSSNLTATPRIESTCTCGHQLYTHKGDGEDFNCTKCSCTHLHLILDAEYDNCLCLKRDVTGRRIDLAPGERADYVKVRTVTHPKELLRVGSPLVKSPIFDAVRNGEWVVNTFPTFEEAGQQLQLTNSSEELGATEVDLDGED